MKIFIVGLFCGMGLCYGYAHYGTPAVTVAQGQPGQVGSVKLGDIKLADK